MYGKLSIVATPIGNLKDITIRAADVLASCDKVACEDTRVTGKLLSALKISKPFISLHEHSTQGKVIQVCDEIAAGAWIAYVSDAGTPGMNDPGGKLVSEALDRQLTVEPIPGPSALTAAISVCGFAMDEFRYLGFAPHKKGRQTFFADIASVPTPSVFLESTHRINKTLDALVQALDTRRPVFVGRELTKLHETLYRGTPSDIRDGVLRGVTKGEFVIIVGPAPKRQRTLTES